MPYESRYISANGVRHHYQDWGNPDKPPLLLLHATGLCASVYQPIAAGLAADFHVMVFDQRGHGDSDPSDGRGYGFQLIGEDLAAIIQELGYPQVDTMGHSSGGVASLIAASLLPGRVRRGVLLDTRVSDRAAIAAAQNLTQRAERTRQKRSVWESREAMAAAYRSRAAFKTWREDVFQAYIEGGTRLLPDGRAELKCHPDTEATFYATRDKLRIADFLAGIQTEFLLLLGAYPGAQTPDEPGVQEFRRLVKNSHVQPLGVGSHFVPLEHPDLVLEAVRRFLTRQGGD